MIDMKLYLKFKTIKYALFWCGCAKGGEVTSVASCRAGDVTPARSLTSFNPPTLPAYDAFSSTVMNN